MYKIPSIFQTISETFNLAADEVSSLIAIYSLSSFVLAIPGGFLADKFGTKKIIAFGILCSLTGAVLGAISFSLLCGNYYALLISRILEGTCYILASVSVPVFINQIIDKKHVGFAIGIWAIRGCIASVIGEALTPILVKNTSISSTWIIYACAVAIAATLVFVFTKNEKIKSCTQLKPTKEKVKNPAKTIYIVFFLISFICISFIQASVVNFTPSILQYNFGIDGSLSGLCSTIPMFVSIFSCVIFGYLVDKAKSYKPLYTFGIALMGPGAFLMMCTEWPICIIGAILLGIGLGAPAVSACAVFELTHTKYHGIMIGLGMSIFSLGQMISTSISQLVLGSQFEGFIACSIMLLCVGIFGTIISLLVRLRPQLEK